MIDININTIISQALAAAVAQATAPLLERIAALEAVAADRHARLRVLEGALTDRVAALENQALVVSDAVDKRLLALENNPAQGVDTTLERRVAALEMHTAVLDQHGGLLEYLDNQEWFWDKLRRFTDTAVEQAIEEHNETYDHSDFVTEDKLDDYVQKDSFRDEIEDVLNNATIRIRF